MGIYTNFGNGSYTSSNYTEVAPFVGENFNYHELGIMAATEMAANHNAFMKSIALSELAAYEETGDTDVLYEAVNLSGVFSKIKMFFKKIIEKIHKIFHTFVAKMSSWFGDNRSFVKNYEKEIVKKWSNVKSDWEFKGFVFKKDAIHCNKLSAKVNGAEITAGSTFKDSIRDAFAGNLARLAKDVDDNDIGNNKNAASDSPYAKNTVSSADNTKYKVAKKDVSDIIKEIKSAKDAFEDSKEAWRKQIVDTISGTDDGTKTNFDLPDKASGYDASEFTEELFKAFRSGEDKKDTIEKSKLLDMYGNSIAGLMGEIKDFDKLKRDTEKTEKALISGIDKLIKDLDKAESDLIKDKSDADKTARNEAIVQMCALHQSAYGFISECYTQAFSALLQAQKAYVAQAKEIAVAIIGQSKKMTEESYDYSSDYEGGYDFISSAKMI